MSQPDPAAQPSNSSPKPLGEYLVEAKLLTPAHIEVALYDQRERGYRLGDILALRGWVKEEIIEWIVQNKLLPERQVQEEDFDTLLVSLKGVLEQKEQLTNSEKPSGEPGFDTILRELQSMLDQDENVVERSDVHPEKQPHSGSSIPNFPHSSSPNTPISPSQPQNPSTPTRKPLKPNPLFELSDRDTLIIPRDDDDD